MPDTSMTKVTYVEDMSMCPLVCFIATSMLYPIIFDRPAGSWWQKYVAAAIVRRSSSLLKLE